jgi:predicted SprT family Zn-dependent metalloprotease
MIEYAPKSVSRELYGKLSDAYTFFNKELFGGELPECLITLQRKKSAYGYFSGDRFEDATEQPIDEIALNPSHFGVRPVRDVLSTLVHEMAHLWQHHFGKSSKNGYHNKQWGKKMKEIGLWPSSTGHEGGKETGTKVSHYIINTGPYDKAFEKFAEHNSLDLFKENLSVKAKSKGTEKVKYTCPQCAAKAWGKINLHIDCGLCEKRMRAGNGNDGDEGEDDDIG